jgi:hypothetical protein
MSETGMGDGPRPGDLPDDTETAGAAPGDAEAAGASPRRVGRYQVVRVLGRGGMSVTYLTREVDARRRIALKELVPPPAAQSFAGRFVREARTVAALSVPGTVPVTDCFEEGGVAFVATRYVERGSVRRWVGQLSQAQVAGVIESVLGALAVAEERRVTHRDLKPENLLIAQDGRVRVSDLGMVRAVERAGSLVMTGTTVGTPAYMAPEQVLGVAVGPAADLYALGVVAYELLAGAPPFDAPDDPAALAERHLEEAPPPLAVARPDLDGRWVDWIERMLAKEPGERPRGAMAAWAELEPVVVDRLGPTWREEAPIRGRAARRAFQPSAAYRLTTLPRRAAPSGPPRPEPVRTSRARRAVIAGVVLALVGGAGAAIALLVGGGGGKSTTTTASATTPATTTAPPATTAPTTTTAPLTTTEFRSRGNAVCAHQPKLVDLFGAVRDPSRIRAVILLALDSSIRPSVAALAALMPPESLRPAHERALALSRREIDLLQGLADDIGRGADPAAATRAALPRLDQLESQANAAFRDLGLTACATAAGPPGGGGGGSGA